MGFFKKAKVRRAERIERELETNPFMRAVAKTKATPTKPFETSSKIDPNMKAPVKDTSASANAILAATKKPDGKINFKSSITKVPEKALTTRERFNAAFKEARSTRTAPGTFMFEGKRYTTETADEKAKTAPSKPAAKSAPASTAKSSTVTPAKKTEPTKATSAPEKKTTSSSDSVRAKMKADNDTLMAKQDRYYGKKYGSFKSGGKVKKKC